MLVSIIVLKVVPAFSDFYASFGANLPLVTRIIVAISDFIRSCGLFLIIAVVAGGLAFSNWVSKPGQKAKVDHPMLSIPMIGGSPRSLRPRSDGAHAGDAAGGGSAARTCDDIASKSVGNQCVANSSTSWAHHAGRPNHFPRRSRRAACFRMWPSEMAEVGESTGALQVYAEYRGGFLR